MRGHRPLGAGGAQRGRAAGPDRPGVALGPSTPAAEIAAGTASSASAPRAGGRHVPTSLTHLFPLSFFSRDVFIFVGVGIVGRLSHEGEIRREKCGFYSAR